MKKVLQKKATDSFIRDFMVSGFSGKASASDILILASENKEEKYRQLVWAVSLIDEATGAMSWGFFYPQSVVWEEVKGIFPAGYLPCREDVYYGCCFSTKLTNVNGEAVFEFVLNEHRFYRNREDVEKMFAALLLWTDGEKFLPAGEMKAVIWQGYCGYCRFGDNSGLFMPADNRSPRQALTEIRRDEVESCEDGLLQQAADGKYFLLKNGYFKRRLWKNVTMKEVLQMREDIRKEYPEAVFYPSPVPIIGKKHKKWLLGQLGSDFITVKLKSGKVKFCAMKEFRPASPDDEDFYPDKKFYY